MNYTKIETIRVEFENGVYCDITPSYDKSCHEFTLHRNGYDATVYMFGIEIANADHAVEIAECNFPEYINELMELCGDDD